MNYTLLNSLSAISIFQLLLLSVFLFSIKKGKRTSNYILAVFFILLAINLSDGLLVYYGFYKEYPALAHFEDGFVFLYGPLLYFYTCSVVYRDFRFRWRTLLHAVPFVVFTVLFQVFYHTQPTDFQRLIQLSIHRQNLPAGFYFSIILVYVHIGVYLYEAYGKIRKYRQKILQQFSDVSQLNLNWLVYMVGFFGALLVVSLVFTFLPLTILSRFIDEMLIIVIAIFFVFINGIVWRALRNPILFTGFEKKEKTLSIPLTAVEKNKGLDILEHLMRTEKPYLAPALTLDQLAEKVGWPSRKLSQLINEHYQQNFFDYINSWRIQEARTILERSYDPKLTVLEVMYQVGFNSKSSFNTLFRKKTGETPSRYRKHQLEMRSTLR